MFFLCFQLKLKRQYDSCIAPVASVTLCAVTLCAVTLCAVTLCADPLCAATLFDARELLARDPRNLQRDQFVCQSHQLGHQAPWDHLALLGCGSS